MHNHKKLRQAIFKASLSEHWFDVAARSNPSATAGHTLLQLCGSYFLLQGHFLEVNNEVNNHALHSNLEIHLHGDLANLVPLDSLSSHFHILWKVWKIVQCLRKRWDSDRLCKVVFFKHLKLVSTTNTRNTIKMNKAKIQMFPMLII